MSLLDGKSPAVSSEKFVGGLIKFQGETAEHLPIHTSVGIHTRHIGIDLRDVPNLPRRSKAKSSRPLPEFSHIGAEVLPNSESPTVTRVEDPPMKTSWQNMHRLFWYALSKPQAASGSGYKTRQGYCNATSLVSYSANSDTEHGRRNAREYSGNRGLLILI